MGNNEFNIFLAFILIGFTIGLLFDIFRVLRRVYKTPDFVTIIQDIAFWIISGIILLLGIFVINEGKIRAYLFIGLFIGIFFYIAIASKAVMKIGTNILNLFNKIVLSPIQKLFKLILSSLFKSTNLFKNRLRKLKIDMFHNKKLEKRRNNWFYVEYYICIYLFINVLEITDEEVF